MKIIKHGEFIRVEFNSDHNKPQDIIKQIRRHVDGYEHVAEDCNYVTYLVKGKEYHYKAEAILAELGLDEKCDAIYETEDKFYRLAITCSEKKTDRQSSYADKTAYEIVEILYHRPYIHSFNVGPICQEVEIRKLQKLTLKLHDEYQKISKAIILNNNRFKDAT